MHPLGQLDGDIQNALQIVGVGDIELIRSEGEDIGLDFDLAAMNSGHDLGSFDKRGRRGFVVASDRDRECRRSGLTGFDEFCAALSRVPVEDVIHSACGITGRADVHCAHEDVRSPRAARTLSTEIRTSRSKCSSTAKTFPEWVARRT